VAESRIRTGIKGLSEGWTLAEFEQYAGAEVRRLANKMLRQQAYIPLELDDLAQVILFTIWDRCIHWDGRGSVEGYVMFKVRCQVIREMMWAKGLARDSHNQWVGAALIPVGEDFSFEPEVFEGVTPEDLTDAKRSVDEFVELACTTERQTVLVMTALKEGTEHGAKLLCEQENIEALGLVRDIGWIQKAIVRALKRARKEYYGDETHDEAQGGEDRRGCETQGSEGGDRPQSLSTGEEGCEQDVGCSDGVARRKRTRSRRRSSQPSALVSCCDA
jgi:DNA-directed RNA polymerase specialized sigma24 family protein